MSEKIAELKLKITLLENEKLDIEQQITEARKELYSAEREHNRAKKPTPAMVETIKVMARGSIIRHSRRWSSSDLWLVDDNGSLNKVRDSVFVGLREREIIGDPKQVESMVEDWGLTDYGREIAKELSR